MSGNLARVLATGCVFGVFGLGCGLAFALLATGEGWSLLPAAAALGAFVPGVAVSALLLARSRTPPMEWRVLAGALVGLVSHPIAWYLMILANYVRGRGSSVGEPPLDPVQGISGALVLSAMSLLLVGWFTVPIAGAIGGAMIRRGDAEPELEPAVEGAPSAVAPQK